MSSTLITPLASAPLTASSIRVLPPEEWPRLLAFEPWATYGLPSDPEYHQFLVAEEAGEIIAFWGIFNAVHVEPVWIHPDHRKRPGLIRRLWRRVRQVLAEHQVPCAFAIVAHVDEAINLPVVDRLGFKRMPGSLFYVDLGEALDHDSVTDPAPLAVEAEE